MTSNLKIHYPPGGLNKKKLKRSLSKENEIFMKTWMLKKFKSSQNTELKADEMKRRARRDTCLTGTEIGHCQDQVIEKEKKSIVIENYEELKESLALIYR